MTEEQELELFAIRSRFFREIPHPKLIVKAMNQVQKIAGLPFSAAVPVDPGKSDLVDFLQKHSDRTYALKHTISSAATPELLYQALDQLHQWQQLLLVKLVAYLPETASFPDVSVRQSDPIDSYLILQFIRSSAIAENQISAYICREIETGAENQLSVLTKACLQARKINTHDGSRTAS